MQKKLIALAIAGLASSGAFAQSNVTIYGVMDIGYFNADSDQGPGARDAKFSGTGNGGLSGNRIGFRVEEDLGNGWKAGGLWEMGTMAIDGGANAGAAGANGIGSTRQSYVQLSSAKYGSFQGGRIYPAISNTAGKFDPEGASGFGPVARLTGYLGLTGDGGQATSNSRLNNSLAWLSPNWNGFTAQVQYAFGENGEQTAATAGSDDASFWGLGIDYTNGPLAVGFAYSDWSDYGGTAQGVLGVEREMTEWFIGASYDFGMVKVTGSYQDFDMDNMVGATAAFGAAQGVTAAAGVGSGFRGAKSEGDIWSLGVIVPVFKVGSVRVSYASLDRNIRAAAVGNAKSSADADGWSLSYQHALSKRTTAYVGYSAIDNDNKRSLAASSIGIGIGGGAGAISLPALGKDTDGWGMGVRHTF